MPLSIKSFGTSIPTRIWIWGAVFGILFSAGVTGTLAQTPLATLYTFTNGGGGGYPIYSPLINKNGILYGASQEGGIVNSSCLLGCGVIFKLSPPSKTGREWKQTVLFSFSGGVADGSGPQVLTSGAGGVLYGMTNSGGTYNAGTVFELSPPISTGGSWTESLLYSFGAYTGDARNPGFNSIVAAASGSLFGTTDNGGSLGVGAVFELTPPTSSEQPWTEAVICSFTTGHINGGTNVGGILLAKGGQIYGAVETGGKSGYGFVYELVRRSSGKWTETDIHDFLGGPLDGGLPITTLIEDSSGSLYGTTFAGGTGSCGTFLLSPGCGTVFMLSPPSSSGGAWTQNILHSFSTGGVDGVAPAGSLLFGNAGALFGTTTVGGAGSCNVYFEPGCGTIFELIPSVPSGSWEETLLYNFTGGTDGYYPIAGLTLGLSSDIYGSTSSGFGIADMPGSGYGTLFQIQP